MDVDDGLSGQWIELGMEHEFALADMGFGSTMILKDMTITPSMALGIDHRLLHVYGVDVRTPRPSTPWPPDCVPRLPSWPAAN